MIPAKRFVCELLEQGVSCFTGVPCSYLTPLVDEVIADPRARYLIASSEGEALAIASGLWLGGQPAVVMCQNSGLGNMVNPLTSLNGPFAIPVLMLVTWRGRPGTHDEPQHAVMGAITTRLLELLGVSWTILPEDEDKAAIVVRHTCALVRAKGGPHALLMPGECFAPTAVVAPANPDEPPVFPRRHEALRAILDGIEPEAAIVATTGKTGRELFALRDAPQHLYCVGSMGFASALAFGVALTTPRRVCVIDGDGAALMHLGNLTSIGAAPLRNFIHVVLDNGRYDSTGGQPTASSNVDFCGVALSVGYRASRRCRDLQELSTALAWANRADGPILLHVPIAPGSMALLGRPTIAPETVGRRLKAWLAAEAP